MYFMQVLFKGFFLHNPFQLLFLYETACLVAFLTRFYPISFFYKYLYFPCCIIKPIDVYLLSNKKHIHIGGRTYERKSYLSLLRWS